MSRTLFFVCVLSIQVSFLFMKPCMAQELPYPPAKEKWDPDSLGNHRALVQVTGQGVAKIKIPWRRPDEHPESKEIIVLDASTGKKITRVYPGVVNREYGILYFETVPGHHTYGVYYMPYRHQGSANYPRDYYPSPVETADTAWITSVKKMRRFAAAHLLKLEAVTPFNAFDPMEKIATQAETGQLIAAHPGSAYLVFPEDRMHPIKMKRDLPLRWIEKGSQHTFHGITDRGEYYAFQLGIFPLKDSLQDVRVTFSRLRDQHGNSIPDSLLSCINDQGISYAGDPVRYRVNIPKRDIQAMWCYIRVPPDAVPGSYEGTATVDAAHAPATVIKLYMTIRDSLAPDHGVGEPWKQTRLPWLNSRMAQENTVIAPYTPLSTTGDTIDLLGRRVILAGSGFPAQIQTFFPIEMTGISKLPNNLLTEAIHFHFFDQNNKNLPLKSTGVFFTQKTPGTVEWQATNRFGSLEMKVHGHLEFDGFMAYQVAVIAHEDLRLKDIQMHIPVRPKLAEYFMGLGYKGQYRPEKIDWKWDVAHKNQDGGWIGTVNAGLHFSLRDQHYLRPLNTNFYLMQPLVQPVSWSNGRQGGIQIARKGNSILINAYNGARMLRKGDTLYYNFNLLVTPFHALNTDWHWEHRYYHDYIPVDSVQAKGADVINIHQGKYINPYINYPFIAWRQMKSYIDSAHQLGMQVKIYNTIRELADRAYELYPLESLGHEIFSPGKGGGYPWLQEHLDSTYIPGWYTPETNDAAIVNGGMSRWHNYYVEGLNWLVRNVGIDGLYLDDVAYDRITMKRVKRVLVQNGHPGMIDLHSANQYDKADGWNNSANLYMSLFPYLNRLWFGENFDYENNSPDYYMTELSGIPYGLMGEMLEGGGNPRRGMLYGMTNRAPWTGSDPRGIWKLWDEFGMKGSRMIGYWVPDDPVKTDNPQVLVTVYKKTGEALVSLASWAARDTTVHLKIDWRSLGIDSVRASLSAPEIPSFQPAAAFQPGVEIPVKKNKGWLLILR